jgi:short-subunit dehydrogenase
MTFVKIAIITGASSGLGKAFAEKIAKTGEVDELWLIARRADRLEMLKNELDITVRPLVLDLRDLKSIELLEKLLMQEKPDVRYLVNSAGFGKIGNYNDLTREECHGMLDINVRALMDVTRAVLLYMGRGSRLLQLASSSAFQPLPGFSVYAATKSFVLSFTRSLRWELRGKGIYVTAVCPGWVKTEFMNVAIDSSNGNVVKHFWPIVSTSSAVNSAMLGNRLGLAVATCGPHTFIQRVAAKILPSWFLMGIWRLIR